MDEDLAMTRHSAADALALAINGDDIVGRHLLETDAGGLHQKAPVPVRQTPCNVSCDVITLGLATEPAAPLDQFFPLSIGHVAIVFSGPPLWAASSIPSFQSTRDPSVAAS